MKLSHFLLLAGAGILSYSTASAQTTPGQGARGTTTASPSAVPSGTAPMANNPKGVVSPGEAFTTGAPATKDKSSHSMKHKKDKSMMSDGSGKMKAKM